MIRLFGILLIAGGMTGAGFLYGLSIKTEIRRWEAFLRLARLIRSRIDCFRQPLSAIYADFSDEELEACSFTEELRKGSFSLALAKTKDNLGLRSSLLDLLSEFGQELGKSHAEDQIRHCDHCIRQMEEALASLRAECPEKLRLTHALSLCFAAMAVLLLL